MNKTFLATALATAFAALLPGSPMSPEAHAGTGIQRCLAPDGTSVYTDKPCAAFKARPVPMSGELLTRLSSADAIPGAALAGYVDAATPLYPEATPRPARRSPASGCARSPTQLAMDLRGAFALGDVNRIAESYHWVGMDQHQATGVMQQLERMSAQPVTDSQYFNASISPGMDSWVAASDRLDDGAGILQLVLGGDGTRIVDFKVQRYSGCYFVQF